MSSNTALVRLIMRLTASWGTGLSEIGLSFPEQLAGRKGVGTLILLARSAIVRENMSPRDIQREMRLIREYRLPYIYTSIIPEVAVSVSLAPIPDAADEQIAIAEGAFTAALDKQSSRKVLTSPLDSLFVHFAPRRHLFRMASGDVLLNEVGFDAIRNPASYIVQVSQTRADLIMTLVTWLFLSLSGVAVAFNPTDRIARTADVNTRVVPNAKNPNTLRHTVASYARGVYGLDVIMTQVVPVATMQRLACLFAQRVLRYGTAKENATFELNRRTMLDVVRRFQGYARISKSSVSEIVDALKKIVSSAPTGSSFSEATPTTAIDLSAFSPIGRSGVVRVDDPNLGQITVSLTPKRRPATKRPLRQDSTSDSSTGDAAMEIHDDYDPFV